ncbi:MULTISPECIES: phage tail protein [Micromonospora]|uniref:Phage tail protein n=1 Tax=Micromonospora antibiotica TaxID=2807623 RepID=A0ABS3V5H0_9ACTN|nr:MULTISPECIES: phage tail protein [Micromonospora]MBO4160872.1 phage tail protein [Micromonospora antibiotica]MBW4701422.1 phage tail protein [Micromonospora sp. RL09-050-HVF-A]
MPTTATPQPGAPVDPYRAYNFKLLINGVTNGHFTEVSGLELTIGRLAYREAGNDRIRSVPGQVDYAPVTLHFGLTPSRELWDWVHSAATGTVSRRNVSVVLLDAAGTAEVLRWNLINAWPMRWRGAHLHTLSQEIAIVALTLAYEGLELEAGGATAPTTA